MTLYKKLTYFIRLCRNIQFALFISMWKISGERLSAISVQYNMCYWHLYTIPFAHIYILDYIHEFSVWWEICPLEKIILTEIPYLKVIRYTKKTLCRWQYKILKKCTNLRFIDAFSSTFPPTNISIFDLKIRLSSKID